ncbi:MAG: glycosyltransferase family 1 protein [Rickettsiales bacterium]|nr:MAG: glycosyltransferase family 1 protein [Rickettsiales bacterium]
MFNHLPFPDIKNSITRRIVNTASYRLGSLVNNKFVQNKLDYNLLNFLNSYDVVSIIKWEVYLQKRIIFDSILHKKIHLMSGLNQYSDFPYKELPHNKTNLILMYPQQKEEFFQEREIESLFKIDVIPLMIDNETWKNVYNPLNDGVLRLGVFSRIHPDQPTIFFLFVVHELKNRGLTLELYFFGRYYDELFYKHYLKTIEVLKIESLIKFVGHVDNIPNSINEFNIDLGLMNSFKSVVGYSSIELQSSGLPVVFFNVSSSNYIGSDFPIILNTVNELCDKIEELWISNKLRNLSERTFSYSKNTYSVRSNENSVLSVFAS